MKKVIIAFSLLLLIAVAVVGWLYYTVQKLQVTVRRLAVEMRKKQMVVVADMEVQNPFFFSLSYFKVDYALRTQEGVLLSGEMKMTGNIKGHDSEMLKIPCSIDVANFQKLRQQLKEHAVQLVFVGQLHVNLKVMQMGIPFILDKEIPQQKDQFTCQVKECRVTHLSPDKIALVLELALANQSPQQIQNVIALYQVAVGDKAIIEGKLTLDSLPPQGTGTASVPLAIDRAALQKIKAVYAGKKVPLVVRGEIHGMLQGNTIAVPFQIVKEVELRERAFEVKLKKIRVQKARLRETTLLAVVEVKNSLPFKLENVQVEGDIELGDKIDAKVLTQGFTLAPGETTTLELEITRQRGGILELAKTLLQQKRANSQLRMKLSGTTEDKAVIGDELEQSDSVEVE
jgi:LEA14-like dessication related protein